MTPENEKEETDVLTLRIPKSLSLQLTKIAKERAVTKTEIVKRYLKLSEIFQINDKYGKIDAEDSHLILYPEKVIKGVLNLVNSIPENDQFKTRLDLGDDLGSYINNITYIRGIHQNDYYSIFKLIEKLGWFTISYRRITDQSSIILIPQSYGKKPLVYSMVYRIVTRKKYPDQWTEQLINHELPHTGEKIRGTLKEENEEFERNYKKYVLKPLEPDLEQEKLDHYYFNILAIQTPTF